MYLNWTRPCHIPYPNVWLKFKAKDVFTDDLVEYTIEDLPKDRFDEAVDFMAKGFLADSPMAKLKNAVNDVGYVADVSRIWKIIVKQKMCHVCFKENSQEIIGLRMNYVSSKNDISFFDDNLKNERFLHNMRAIALLHSHGNFDVFESYGVDNYLSSFGVYVPQKFAGRKIGEKLTEASKYMAKPIGIKLCHAFYQSDISNRIADKLGYKVDVELSFEEIQRLDPTLNFQNIESSKASLRTWIFEE